MFRFIEIVDRNDNTYTIDTETTTEVFISGIFDGHRFGYDTDKIIKLYSDSKLNGKPIKYDTVYGIVKMYN